MRYLSQILINHSTKYYTGIIKPIFMLLSLAYLFYITLLILETPTNLLIKNYALVIKHTLPIDHLISWYKYFFYL